MKSIIKYLLLVTVALLTISCEKEFKLKGLSTQPRAFVEFFPSGDDSSLVKVCVAYPSQMMIEDQTLSSLVDDPASCVSISVDGVQVPAQNDSKSIAYVHRKFNPGETVTIDIDLGGGCTASSKTVIPPAIKDYKIVRMGNDVVLDYFAEQYPEYMSLFPEYELTQQITKQDGTTTINVEYGQSHHFFIEGVLYGMRYNQGYIYYWKDSDSEKLENGWHRMRFRIFFDRLYNGGEYVIQRIDYNNWYIDEETGERRYVIDTLTIKESFIFRYQICGIHEDMYRYMQNMDSIEGNVFGKFGLAPTIFNWTNVQGGFGIVSGMSTLSTGWFHIETAEN